MQYNRRRIPYKRMTDQSGEEGKQLIEEQEFGKALEVVKRMLGTKVFEEHGFVIRKMPRKGKEKPYLSDSKTKVSFADEVRRINQIQADAEETINLLSGIEKDDMLEKIDRTFGIYREIPEDVRKRVNKIIRKYIKEKVAERVAFHIKNSTRYEEMEYTSFDRFNEEERFVKIGKFNPKDYDELSEFFEESSGQSDYPATYMDVIESEIIDDMRRNGKLKKAIMDEIWEWQGGEGVELCRYLTERYIDDTVEELLDMMYDMGDERFNKVYVSGCRILGIEPEYEEKEIGMEDVEPHDMEKIREVYNSIFSSEEFEIALRKKAEDDEEKLKGRIKRLLAKKVYNNGRSMEKFIKEIHSNIIREYFEMEERGQETRELLDKLLEKIVLIEAYAFKEYTAENQTEIDIAEVAKYRQCRKAIITDGIVHAAKYTYIAEKRKEKIRELLPENPKDEFPLARAMKRRFVIHVGPTNTGKTHEALERLKQAETGLYLAPLRLLALEVQERLNNEGVPCSLITGEEEHIVPSAKHIASTVEKADLQNRYDVCVIDECQMIGDKQRGGAWTKAILGVLADEIHLCTAPEGLNILKRIIEDCGESYEVVEHRRDTELIVENDGFNLKRSVRDGDALVVFSKRDVLAVAAKLYGMGIKASVIYGTLPYQTRKKQFERFLKGETKVVVCTDAIGMGVNLPIRRVVFLETEKYDGERKRELSISEIKQIAGRAGRKGIYDVGYVNAVSDKKRIKKALESGTEEIQKAYLSFSNALLKIDEGLIDVLKTWQLMEAPDMYEKADITRTINLLYELKELKVKLTKEEMLRAATVTFDERNEVVHDLWKEYIKAYSWNARTVRKPVRISDTLQDLEDYYECLDLYYAFSRSFNLEMDVEWVEREKTATSDKINNILVREIMKHVRRCRECGRELEWDYPYGICKECYDDMYGYRYYYDDDFDDAY